MIRCIIIVGFALLMSANAFAETVFVRSGQNEGQGWAFWQDGICWLVTPKHVATEEALMVSGTGGVEAQGHSVRRHDDLDIAVAELTGSFAKSCPSYATPLGDSDTAPTLRRLISEGRTISLEKRTGTLEGGAFGLEILAVQIDALSGTEPIFMSRTIQPKDQIIRTDSGSPIRLRGSGLGEAGLPLGLLITVEETEERQFLTVLRMDAVRDFFNRAAGRQNATSDEVSLPFEIDGFSGQTPDTECAPLNLLTPGTDCGWKVERGNGQDRISIQLSLKNQLSVSLIEVEFGMVSMVDGISIKTALGENTFTRDRYCRKTEAAVLKCEIAARTADRISIVIDGRSAEIIAVQIK